MVEEDGDSNEQVTTTTTTTGSDGDNTSVESDLGASATNENAESRTAFNSANKWNQIGVNAANNRDYKKAVGCFSRALEIWATHLGEDAIESAKAYHKYGRALLDKALQEADPTSSLARKEGEFREYFKEFYFPATTESSDASGSSQQGDAEGKDQESEVKSDSEGLFGADKDQSDLDLANKILAKARDIAQQYLEKARNTILGDEALEVYDIFSAFVEVALAREDFESSLLRYHDTLLILGRALEHDSTQIIKLNSRLCIYLASARPSDAIKYCETAIIVSKSRIKLIETNAEVIRLTSPDPVNEAASTREIGRLTNLVGKLEQKLHDLEKIVTKKNAVPGGNIDPRTAGSTEAPSTSGTAGNTETASTSGTAGTPETASTSGTAGSTPETASPPGTAGTPETASRSGTGGSSEAASTSGTGGSTETPSTSDTGYAGGESDQGSEGRGVKRDPTGPSVDPSPTKKPAFDSP